MVKEETAISTELKVETALIEKPLSDERDERLERIARKDKELELTYEAHLTKPKKRRNFKERKSEPPLKRSIPFFKILTFPGSKFAVDAFCYGPLEVDAYFLTHFHSDHYGGLSGSWKWGPIYCTPATARLVHYKLNVDPKYLCEVEIGQPCIVNGVRVFFLDANHCPGSSIILFNNKVLHTGDFRASPEILETVRGYTTKLDKCYLDTTYLDPKRVFPTQSYVISRCVEHCLSVQSTNQRSFFLKPRENRLLVMVGSYTIGKERLAIAIAKALDSKIWTPEPKLQILNLLKDNDLDELLLKSGNGVTCQVHLVSMSELNKEKLAERWKFLKKHYTHLLAFVPTGWTFRGTFDPASLPCPTSGTIGICKVPYSEHSSYEELQNFCNGIQIGKIIATVGSAHLNILQQWETR